MRASLIALLAIFLLSPALAQEPPTEEEILDSLYMTVALLDFCDIAVAPPIADALSGSGLFLERRLGLTRAESDARYERFQVSLLADPPDCDPDGADIGPLLDRLAHYQDLNP